MTKPELDPETQKLADIVDGKYSEEGVEKYSYIFTKDSPNPGDTRLTAIIDSASGGMYMNESGETIQKLHQVLEAWKKLLTLESLTPPPLVNDPAELAKHPDFTENVNKIHELRKQLFIPNDQEETA